MVTVAFDWVTLVAAVVVAGVALEFACGAAGVAGAVETGDAAVVAAALGAIVGAGLAGVALEFEVVVFAVEADPVVVADVFEAGAWVGLDDELVVELEVAGAAVFDAGATGVAEEADVVAAGVDVGPSAATGKAVAKLQAITATTIRKIWIGLRCKKATLLAFFPIEL